MAKYKLYPYEPTNPHKFKGTLPIIFRSSWELEFAKHCDLLPTVLEWNYEAVKIPYSDPVTGKQKIYIPDFFVTIAQKDGYAMQFVFEIKPRHEQDQAYARNSKDSALVARNHAKWLAASQWADRHSSQFEVLNEADLYSWHEAKKPRKHPVRGFAHTNTATKAKKPKAPKVAGPVKVAAKPTSQRKIQSRVSGVGRVNRVPKVR